MVYERWNKKLEEFLKVYYIDEILELATEYPETKSLYIDFFKIETFNTDLANDLLVAPEKMITVFEQSLANIDLPLLVSLKGTHIRIINLPTKTPIRDLRSKDLSRLISVEGMIRRATEVRPKIMKAAFRCLRCDYITYVDQPSFKLEEPYAGCENENCMKKGPFKIEIEESVFVDSQKGQIQELPESIRGGTNPQSIEINMGDDLTGQISPGDRVVINGILKSVQRSVRDGKSTYFDLFIDVNSVERTDGEFDSLDISAEEEQQIIEMSADPDVYDKIIESIAPTIFGAGVLKDVKEALMLQLFSGVTKNLPDGSRVRGDIHIMLVGDPGVAKSQLLRYIVRLSPRGVFTSGKSASASGLTAAAVRDELGDGRWTIEGGALVMADMGIAAVDEMDKMRDEDKSALHEAMEQQTISIAKAGILATLKSRCALLGAANPVYGRFDRYEGIANQINMPPALLSRFDLIFVLLDVPENKQDTRISKHIVQTHYAGELIQQKENVSNADISQEYIDSQTGSIKPIIASDLLRKYVAYARRNVYPVMDTGAREHLINFYTNLRKLGEGKGAAVPTTARQLEALVRLTEASARVRLGNTATVEDAMRATDLTLKCLKMVGVDPTTGSFDVDIISAGVSKTQRDRIGTLKEIIRTISDRTQGGKASVVEILSEAEQAGIKSDEIETYLDRMGEAGEIIRPDNKHIRLVSRH